MDDWMCQSCFYFQARLWSIYVMTQHSKRFSCFSLCRTFARTYAWFSIVQPRGISFWHLLADSFTFSYFPQVALPFFMLRLNGQSLFSNHNLTLDAMGTASGAFKKLLWRIILWRLSQVSQLRSAMHESYKSNMRSLLSKDFFQHLQLAADSNFRAKLVLPLVQLHKLETLTARESK